MARHLHERGVASSIDQFGELVPDAATAERVAVDRQLAGKLADLPADAWLSVDLSHLGLDIDPRPRVDHLTAITEALPSGRRIQVGAEDHDRADAVLECVLALADIDSYWNVRYTWSGQFVHAAPWSVSAQGERNVSHGCINMSTADAKWFYEFTQPGDIIKVTGTPREVEWGNGWTDWEMSFEQYLDGSATGEPVHTLTMDGEPRTQL